MHSCPAGHEIRSSADRNADGWCKQCRSAKNHAYRTRQSAALALAQELEARGLDVTRSDPPVDLPTLAAALSSGHQLLEEIQMTDPQTLRQMLLDVLTAGAEAHAAKQPKTDDGPDPGAEFARFFGEHMNNDDQ